MKIKHYLKTEFKAFFGSFRLKFNFIQTFFYDFSFYILMLLISLPLFSIVQKKGDVLSKYTGLLAGDAILKATESEQLALLSSMEGFVFAALAVLIAFVIVSLTGWSLSAGLIYCNLLKKRYSFHYFKKFIGLNFVLFLLLILFIILASALISAESNIMLRIAQLLILLMVYFAVHTYIQFTKHTDIFSSIGKGLSFGAKKIHFFIIPGIFMYIIAAAVSIVFALIVKYNVPVLSMEYVFGIAYLAAFAAFLAWARVYFVGIAERV